MKQPVTISRSPELTAGQDYHRLRREGLRHIEQLSSDLWTDYNSHDPGITLLELLCYAITDLGWRTRHDVPDLLAERTGSNGGGAGTNGAPSGSGGSQASGSSSSASSGTLSGNGSPGASPGASPVCGSFYTAREILTTAPVTLLDYRKLLIDIRGIRNAWIEPVEETDPGLHVNFRRSRLQYEPEDRTEPLHLRGIYDIILELDHDPAAGDLNRYTAEIPLEEETPLHQDKIMVDMPSWDRLFTPGRQYAPATEVILTVKESDGRTGFTGEVVIRFGDRKIRRDIVVRTTRKDIPQDQVRDQIELHGIETWYRNKINAALQIVHDTWQVLHRNRNLCEDFRRLKGMDVEDVRICADINVAAGADLEQVLASVVHTVSRHIAPDVPFYTLQELLQQNMPVEEIFNGPALDHGFITGKDLEDAELKQQINVSDLINLIMDIEGVISIRSITLTSSYKGRLVEKDAEWRLNITGGRAPRLDADGSKIVFYKDDVPFAAGSDRTRKLLRDLQLAGRESKLSPEEQTDLPVPEGRNRNISDFTSVRVDLPDTYNVNRKGISDPLTTDKKARAAQLQAFLTLFDQLLANYLAQLSNLKHLFSFDRTLRRTCFNQYLFRLPGGTGPEQLLPGSGAVFSGEDPPRIWIVLLHFIRFIEGKGVSPDDLHDRDEMEQLRREFLQQTDIPDSEISQYLAYLDRIIESPEQFLRRRNRFLDHLLGRFGEQFTDYVLLVHSSGEPDAAERLIEDKSHFLEEAPRLSSERGKAFDYTDPDEIWDTGNVSGFQKRLSRLLGIRNYNRRTLLCREADRFFEIYEDAAGKWRFRFRDDDGSVLLRSSAFPDRTACENAVELVKQRGGEKEHYKYRIAANGRFYFNLLDDENRVMGTGLLFATEADREQGLTFLTNKLGICNKEGFYLVEHQLLRPHKKGDPLLPVCLSGEGSGCPGFRDPYSFRISLVVPYWPRRFRSMQFRRLFEKTARMELPAHIHVKICWVNEEDMEKFEDAYRDWLKEMTRPVSDDRAETAGKLIRVMAGIRSIYPVSKLHICSEEDEQNPILLDRSILGTFKQEEP